MVLRARHEALRGRSHEDPEDLRGAEQRDEDAADGGPGAWRAVNSRVRFATLPVPQQSGDGDRPGVGVEKAVSRTTQIARASLPETLSALTGNFWLLDDALAVVMEYDGPRH